MELLINELCPDDWDQVRQIYLDGLATGQGSFEVEAPSWETWSKNHLVHSRLVARQDGCIIAWGALSPVSALRCYAGVAEVSLYVDSENRGRGVGRRLLQAVIDSSEKNGIWTLCGATFPENQASLRLQLACGFRIVGRRERIAHRHGVWRDTILTERRSRVVEWNNEELTQ